MKKSIFFPALAIVFAFLFIQCADDDPSYKAEKLTLSQLKNNPSFSTVFSYDFDRYKPDTNCVKEISLLSAKTPKKIAFFVSCYVCASTQKYFSYGAKTLVVSGTPDSVFEIYSLRNTSDSRPYSEYSMSGLPSIWILESGKLIYSVVDSLQKIDSLRAKGLYNGKDTTIESHILIGLKN